MSERHRFLVEVGGPRPPYGRIAEHLWGRDVDIDSDGDSQTPEDTNWTELTLTRRPAYVERIEIDPVERTPLTLQVVSASRPLAHRAAVFLAQATGGRVVGRDT